MGRKSRIKRAPEVAADTPAPPPRPTLTTLDWWIVGTLLVLNLVVYGQVASHAFLNYDDGQFIYENAAVRDGLTLHTIAWALTSASVGWYPLTWLSHMLDVTLWGLKPGGHLLTQLLLHAASSVILFLALRRLTAATYLSAFVAALFAIHPAHVESVAWASERKDTLSTLFAMLVLYVYGSRTESLRKHLAVAVLFAASLMAKQMYVTLPFVLMLLDWWPLRRGIRIAEKVPLLALTVIASGIAVVGQKNLGALQSVHALPISVRIANALDGYVRYLGKLFWPLDLAVPYPMIPVPWTTALAAVLLIVAVTAAAWWLRDRAPYLLVGWLWYLGTLVPVIGIIQIGPQSIADRYTYFPYIGLFIAIVWGLASLIPQQRFAAYAGAVIIAILTVVAWHQTSYWKDSETLFIHAIEVTPPNSLAEYSLGQTLQMDAPDRAIPHFDRAIALAEEAGRTNPNAPPLEWYPQAFVGRATAQLVKARAAPPSDREKLISSAERDLHRALTVDPEAAHARNNLEVAQVMRREMLIDPETVADVGALLEEGARLTQQGRYEEAVTRFQRAVDTDPNSVAPRIYLGLGLIQAQRQAEAVASLREAEKIDAARANDLLTRMLRVPLKPTNLRDFIAVHSH
jgi:tetratricopeptide (TPR) repeat protein